MLTNQTTTVTTARLVGALILITYAAVFIGADLTGAVLDEPDYLLNAYPDRDQVTIGVLVEMVNDLAVIGIAVLLYPLLRKVHEGLALGYVGFRILEGGFFMVSKVSSLALVDVSKEFLASGSSDTSTFEGLGTLAFAQRDAAGEIATVAFIVGGLALYYLLLQSELVPRFISIWGLLALASLTAAKVFAVPDLTQTFEPAMLLYLPIVANELFLAGWLLLKGFSSPAAQHERPGPALAEQA